MNIHGVGTQLFVWSQIYGREGQSLEDYLDETLAEVASAGYDGFETNLSFIRDQERTDRFSALLKKHSLKAPSLYHGGVYHEREQAERTVTETLALANRAVTVGCTMINVNPSPKKGGEEKTDEELIVQAEYLNKLGSELNKLGLGLVLHNHTPEIANDARELRANCAYTNPRHVNLCLDTHWVWRSRLNPFHLMRAYRNRVKSLHIRNSINGVWSEALGEGDINHADMRNQLDEIGFNGWIFVELAYEAKTSLTRSLVENARLSCVYVREVFVG
ncbi:sugar phosphate isomerase/epimerase [Candidatus Poribacteria bacterium]|nr:sugar phosphate isomerase/epimerase [Candidatus Poribacteria bacterium]